jgi:hypothetical protein
MTSASTGVPGGSGATACAASSNCPGQNLWRASAGLARGTKIKPWVFHQREENRIAAAKEQLSSHW